MGETRAFSYSRFIGNVLNLIIGINMIKVNYILFYKLKGDCEVYFITSNPLFNIFQSIILHPDSSCTLELLGLVGWGGRRLTIDVFKEKGK